MYRSSWWELQSGFPFRGGFAKHACSFPSWPSFAHLLYTTLPLGTEQLYQSNMRKLSPLPEGSLTVVVREAVSCCFTFSTHIFQAGAWIQASNIPATSKCLSIPSGAPMKASNRAPVLLINNRPRTSQQLKFLPQSLLAISLLAPR